MDDNDNGQIYKIIGDPGKTPDEYCGELFSKTKILAAQCYKVNDQKDLFIRFPNKINLDQWTSTKNLNILQEIGLAPKLSSDQMDRNSLYINSAPNEIFNKSPDEIMNKINQDNPNIRIISIFIPAPKSRTQNLGSIKITLATRLMANSVLYYGLKLMDRHLQPDYIQQGLYLTREQCTYCQNFHAKGACNKTKPTCPNCGGEHRRFECRNKDKRPWCVNCTENHKATSNKCEMRRAHLTTDPIDDMDMDLILNPFGEEKPTTDEEEPAFIQAPVPTINPWVTTNKNKKKNTPTASQPQNLEHGTPNVLNNLTPLTTYYDCLRMALLFEDWYGSFLELQPLLGLPRMEMSSMLRQNMKGPKDTHPRDVREEAMKHQQNLQTQKQEQRMEDFRMKQLNKPYRLNPRQNEPTHTETYNLENNHQDRVETIENMLTGANREPIQQRTGARPKNRKVGPVAVAQRAPLLPTPTDPYQKDNAMTQHFQSEENNTTIKKKPQTPNLSSTQPIMPSQTTKAHKKGQNERLSLGPEEFRDTVRSFENLSKNKETANQITAIINNSRTEILNQSTHNNDQNTTLDNQNRNIQFSMGTYTAQNEARASISRCTPNSREAFKHKTPTEEDSETDSNEEVQIESEEDTLPDLKTQSKRSNRTLRSNSQSR